MIRADDLNPATLVGPVLRVVALSICLMAVAPRAHSQTPPAMDDIVSVRVLPGWREAGGRHVAGLAVALRPGWKTYWRSAGSLGISPSFDWTGTRNLKAISPIWPLPSVFVQAGGQSVGYDRDFVLPLVVMPRDAGGPVTLRGRFDLGVCHDVCIPAQVEIDAVLPPAGAPDASIAAALADRPAPARVTARCNLTPGPSGPVLSASFDDPGLGPRPAVVFELTDPALWVTDAVVERRGGRLAARAGIVAPEGRPVAVDRGTIRITVIGPRGGVEISGCTG